MWLSRDNGDESCCRAYSGLARVGFVLSRLRRQRRNGVQQRLVVQKLFVEL